MLTTQRRALIGLLGPLRFTIDGDDVETPSGRTQALLEILLTIQDRRVPADDIARAIWPNADVRTGRRRLQLVASRLRRALPPGTALEVVDGAYVLYATTDADLFHQLTDAAHRGDADAARMALDLWRGDAFETFADTIAVRHARAVLHDQRDRLAAAIGSPPAVAPRRPAARRPVGNHEILRVRLHDMLPSIGGGRLVALVAPGGYGKTTLLRHWSSYSDGRVAWIDATSDHDTEAAVCAAVRSALGIAPSSARIRPDLRPSAPDGDTVNAIVNQLLVDTRPTSIVFDGVELVREPAAQAALSELVRLAPAHVTVAISSRQRLPPSIIKPAATVEAVTLGPEDLAFTRDELADVVDRAGGRRDAAFVGAVHALTRGWPAPATHLTTRTPAPTEAHIDPTERTLDQLDASAEGGVLRHLPDSFLDEVIRDVTPGDRAWMIATAHLGELDPGLCDAVTDSASRPVIERVIADHQLLEQIDGRLTPRPPLLHLLRRRQHDDGHAARRGHARASRWYLRHERTTEALDHALASDDWALVPATAERALWSAVTDADVDALRRWVPQLASRRDLSDAAAVLAHLASGLFPVDARGTLRAAGRSVPDAARAAAESIDSWSQGDCGAALARVARARELFDSEPTPASSVVDAVLTMANAECQVLVDPAISSMGGSELMHVATRSDWPWVKLRAYGLVALQALVANREQLARTLLDHARSIMTELHPSGRGAAGAYASIALALVDGRLDDERTLDQTTARLSRLADDADRFGWVPVSVAARYAELEIRLRAGDTSDARARLADADERRSGIPELGLLTALQRRCVELLPDEVGEATSLTDRERTVLRHLDSDMTFREIADALFTSVHTVRTQARSIYRKLGVSRRADAVATFSGLCTNGR